MTYIEKALRHHNQDWNETFDRTGKTHGMQKKKWLDRAISSYNLSPRGTGSQITYYNNRIDNGDPRYRDKAQRKKDGWLALADKSMDPDVEKFDITLYAHQRVDEKLRKWRKSQHPDSRFKFDKWHNRKSYLGSDATAAKGRTDHLLDKHAMLLEEARKATRSSNSATNRKGKSVASTSSGDNAFEEDAQIRILRDKISESAKHILAWHTAASQLQAEENIQDVPRNRPSQPPARQAPKSKRSRWLPF